MKAEDLNVHETTENAYVFRYYFDVPIPISLDRISPVDQYSLCSVNYSGPLVDCSSPTVPIQCLCAPHKAPSSDASRGICL